MAKATLKQFVVKLYTHAQIWNMKSQQFGLVGGITDNFSDLASYS